MSYLFNDTSICNNSLISCFNRQFFAKVLIPALLFVSACSNTDSGSYGGENDAEGTVELAKIYRHANYDVNAEYDLVYGQGLSHTAWNTSSSTPIDLRLDAYTPDNNETSRPVMIFIHGGGFKGGDKLDSAPSEFSRYFAERGFVSFSINYRLLRDYGTIPETINEAINANTELSLENKDQAKAVYPAVRDAKAALRWVAANANQYGIDPEFITVIGGSAGAMSSIALGVSATSDFVDELSQSDDNTLSTTHLTSYVDVKVVVDHWGGTAALDLLEEVYGVNRWDETDPMLSIVHGTADTTVPYAQAERLVEIYQQTGAYYELFTLEGSGHGAWQAEYEGKPLTELSFDFITRMLNIPITEN